MTASRFAILVASAKMRGMDEADTNALVDFVGRAIRQLQLAWDGGTRTTEMRDLLLEWRGE